MGEQDEPTPIEWCDPRDVLEAVVLSDGTVGTVTVVRSVDSYFGLDEQAFKAVKQWLFKPGLKDGKPVPVRVQVEMASVAK